MEVEHARAAGVASYSTPADGHLVLPHQLLAEAGGAVAVEDGAQHFQGVGVAVLRAVAQHRGLVAHEQHRQFGRGLDRQLAQPPGQVRPGVCGPAGAAFEGAVEPLGQGKDGLVVHVAGDHHVGVVGDVPLVVPRRASAAVMVSRSFIQPMMGRR